MTDGTITTLPPGARPDRKTEAIARALHAGRIDAIENETVRDLERMRGSYGEDYAAVPAFVEELAFLGFAVTELEV